MSLINDALKRASATKPERPAETFSAPPLQPFVESSPKSSPLPLILCIVGIGALLVSGAFWLKSKGTATEALSPQKVASLEPTHSKQTETQAPAIITPPISSNPVPAAPAQPVVEQPQPPLASVTASVPQETLTEATPEPKPDVAAASPTKPAVMHTANGNRTFRTAESATPSKQLAAPKLQAIYYRLKGPTAMINGKTLRQGEMVDGIKVIAIERNAVEVDINGNRQRLTLR